MLEHDPPPDFAAKSRRFGLSKRVFIWGGVPLLVLAVSAGTWLVLNTKPIPGKYRQGLNFELYYPKNLPAGYTVNRSSFQRDDKVLIFSINAPNGRQIAVSEEQIPVGLDLSQHTANPSAIKLPDQDTFTTSIGSAQTSFWGDKYVTSLVTQNTWIILNVTGFTNKESEKVAQSLIQI